MTCCAFTVSPFKVRERCSGLFQREKDHAKQREARKDVVPALAGLGDLFLEDLVQKKLGEPTWKRRGNVFAFFALLCVK